MKIKTYEDFINRINEDLVWRKKEINYFYLKAQSQSSLNKKFYIRAGIALLYSHWEGYIKNTCELYLIHVKSQKKCFSELKTNFLTVKFMNELKNCTESVNQKYLNDVLDRILNCNTQKASFSENNVIKTNSNLTSSVLESILTIVGIETDLFELRHNLIDEILVKKRNEIVHGENIDYDLDTLFELKENVVEMLNGFKDRFENAASLKEYMV